MAGSIENVKSCYPTTKTIIAHCLNISGHQTWQGGSLPWRAPPIKSHDHLITWPCKITWQTMPKCSTTMPTATKLGTKLTYKLTKLTKLTKSWLVETRFSYKSNVKVNLFNLVDKLQIRKLWTKKITWGYSDWYLARA